MVDPRFAIRQFIYSVSIQRMPQYYVEYGFLYQLELADRPGKATVSKLWRCH